MQSHAHPNIKIQKKLKKLSNWIGKLRSYALFEIGKNAKYSLEQLMDLPLAAALNNTSIEYVSTEDENRPSADDFYYHTNNKLTKDAILKMQLTFSAKIYKLLKNVFGESTFDIAIDFTEDCFYGDKENNYVVGGERKNSTNYFFRYINVAIVKKGSRFVLFTFPVSKDDNNDALLVEKAIIAIRKLGISIRRVLLDREFENSKICFACDVYGIEFIFPKKKDEKILRWIAEYKRDGKKFPRIIENYEIENYPVNVLLMEEENSKGEKEIYGYATNIEAKEIQKDPYAISEYYKQRWAIENANKFQDSFNIHTNSTNGLVRYFFFVLSALLHNFWVLMNLFAQTSSLWKVSLNMLKDITKAILGFASIPNYKHPQRKLWLTILLGKNTTAKCCAALSFMYSFFKSQYVEIVEITSIC